jgi:3-hydroxybutyrate dehydrogenase
MVEAPRPHFGAVDILVNNAGIQHVAPVESSRSNAGTRSSPSTSPPRSTPPARRRCRMMRAKNWGRIINIASAHGLVASPQKAAYVAAKHGMVGLTKVVALETGGTGITCNAICPGWVLTPLVRSRSRTARRSPDAPTTRRSTLVVEKTPSKDFSTPEQIGGLAVFLCSPAADQIDEQGNVFGGHLRPGSKVRTTAEILVTVLPDVVFRRRADPRTGHRELIIEPRPPGPDPLTSGLAFLAAAECRMICAAQRGWPGVLAIGEDQIRFSGRRAGRAASVPASSSGRIFSCQANVRPPKI